MDSRWKPGARQFAKRLHLAPPAMHPAELIARKRDGQELSADEISGFVSGFVEGSIPDYQMSAFAMAVLFRGMRFAETAALTQAMLDSGVVLAWPEASRPVGDKHSTGGIGDKVSLILAPLLAAVGVDVPMISGRGLGPTGGTLDKLEAIPGFRTDLSLGEFQAIVGRVGCAISSATEQLAPADRKLYALRDVTGTVPSIPLITASILSKKLAAGLQALVLDVKWGSGAFMQTLPEARQLAHSLVGVAHHMGLPVVTLITDMNQPLGRMVGNAVEVVESVESLRGAGPDDLMQCTLALGAELLVALGLMEAQPAAEDHLRHAWQSGAAWEKWQSMVRAQGGDPNAALSIAPRHACPSPREGYVQRIDARKIGQLVIELGGGRRIAGDRIDHSVGIEMLVRIGDRVMAGEPLAHVFAGPDRVAMACERLTAAIELGVDPIPPPPLVVERLDAQSLTSRGGAE